MQGTIQNKQKYLVQQIIDKGFDAQDFQQYMIDNAGADKNIDLNNWDFNQLKIFVKKYQQSKKQKLISQQEQNQNHQYQQNQNFDHVEQMQQIYSNQRQQQLPDSGQYLQFNPKTKYQTYSQVVQCIQSKPSQLLTKDVNINIVNFIKKQGSIFQSSFYTYQIQTPCIQSKVQRRYNDFLWLRDTLKFIYVGLPIPPIAKKGNYRRTDDKHLNKRRMILQKFLNQLVQIPQIKGDDLLYNFLTISDNVKFQRYKSDNKKQKSVKISQMKNMRGKLNLVIQNKVNKFLAKSQRHIVQIQPLTKKIFKQYKRVATLLEQASLGLKNISNICQQINQKQQKFRIQNQIKYLSSNIYTVISQSNKKYSQLLQEQAKLFRTQIYSSIKYTSLDMNSILQQFDNLKMYQTRYKQAKLNLFKKKQKIYQQMGKTKQNKNQVLNKLLPQQNKVINTIRKHYGLRNFMMYQQLNRYFQKNQQYLSKYLMNYVKNQSRISSQYMMVWVDAQTQLMSLQQGKSIKQVYY